ncbi:hypothetical protein COO60DRAFT_1463572 [Scenedesmus sp. NREL 46B-D3]|nr:hypothetical protein COO60DRAFT_1463572 [Scenedesmus sp. NREL 46B-D3]
MPSTWARALTILLATTTAALASCAMPWQVPRVEGADSSASDPASYGRCTASMEPQLQASSHWCKFGRMGSWPEWPNAAASSALKFSRATCYRGPINGSSPAHLAACKEQLVGSPTHASVAVSTKYLKTTDGGWARSKGSCGLCMCISIMGADDEYNKGVHRWVVQKYKGMSFMGRVIDRCGECPPDSIDILLDRPFSYAPTWPEGDNPNAGAVNRLPSPRVFGQTTGPETAESVGTWTALWQFVPCEWSHAKCAAFVASYGATWRVIGRMMSIGVPVKASLVVVADGCHQRLALAGGEQQQRLAPATTAPQSSWPFSRRRRRLHGSSMSHQHMFFVRSRQHGGALVGMALVGRMPGLLDPKALEQALRPVGMMAQLQSSLANGMVGEIQLMSVRHGLYKDRIVRFLLWKCMQQLACPDADGKACSHVLVQCSAQTLAARHLCLLAHTLTTVFGFVPLAGALETTTWFAKALPPPTPTTTSQAPKQRAAAWWKRLLPCCCAWGGGGAAAGPWVTISMSAAFDEALSDAEAQAAVPARQTLDQQSRLLPRCLEALHALGCDVRHCELDAAANEHAMLVKGPKGLEACAKAMASAEAEVLLLKDASRVSSGPTALLNRALDALEQHGASSMVDDKLVAWARLMMHREHEWPAIKRRRLGLLKQEWSRGTSEVAVLQPPAPKAARQPPAPTAAAAASTDAVSKMYVFLYQGLWSEQLHHRVVCAHQQQQQQLAEGLVVDTDALEAAVEEERRATWVATAKCKRRTLQLATMQAMLGKGAPQRGILGFLWRHPECRVPGAITAAVKHHKYSETLGRTLEAGWLQAFAAWAGPDDGCVSEEDEHEGDLGV